MPTKVLYTEQDGTPKQIVFGDIAGDFNPATANDLRNTTAGNRTTVQLTTASKTNNTAQQSKKFDFGTDWARLYKIRAAIEFAATPTAGNVMEFWLAESHHATDATANPGGVSGSDSNYTGYSSNLDASIQQLRLIGIGRVTAQAATTVQIIDVGLFIPASRYASLIIYNKSGASYDSDDIQTHFVFDPVVDENQTP